MSHQVFSLIRSESSFEIEYLPDAIFS